MKTRISGLGLVLFLAGLVTVFAADPQANTTFGLLRGVSLKTQNGANISGFLGIPYAEPPTKELRFKNPVLWTKNYTGVKNATKDGSACLQVDKNTQKVTGSEDCLYLNVFTPKDPTNNTSIKNANLSVIVFINGDAFNQGRSSSSLFAPKYLLDHNVVLVTLNYRLNVMGFFSTGNSISPGNYGLKDIVAALHWVKHNINAFGGNPNSITLLGAGSGATASLLLSSVKSTDGLFHKIISMSAYPSVNLAVHSRPNIRNESLRVAEKVDCLKINANQTVIYADCDFCNQNNSAVNNTQLKPRNGKFLGKTTDQKLTTENVTVKDEDIMKCLRSADPVQIVLNSLHNVWRGNPECIFGPTLEAEEDGAILTLHPKESLKEGLYRDISWITGVVADEGYLKTADIVSDESITSDFTKRYKELLVPHIMEMNQVLNNITSVTQAIESFYFKNNLMEIYDQRHTNDFFNLNITKAVGDALITWPTYDFYTNRIKNMNSSAYFYSFGYKSSPSTTWKPGHFKTIGVSHYDDVNYLFPFLNNMYNFKPSIKDKNMTNIMCEIWTNFAKTGIPSAKSQKPWEKGQFVKLGYGGNLAYTMERNFAPDRMDFWNQTMNKYSLPITELKVVSASKGNNTSASNSGNSGNSGVTEKPKDGKGGAERYSVGGFLYLGIPILWVWWSSVY